MGKGAAQKSAIQSFTVNLSVPGKRHNEASVQDFIALHYSPMHHDYPLIIRTFFCCVRELWPVHGRGAGGEGHCQDKSWETSSKVDDQHAAEPILEKVRV